MLKKFPFGILEISVKDQGVGIKKEDQKKLFKLFGFLDDTKEVNTQGIGLGLHICKKLTKQLGGDIICKSESKKGAEFVFLVPILNSSQY